ncbi:MAG: redoxin family protein [Xanthomonadales bacterium]|nr:peroxiredoxin [Xanthomonadales bacterium]NIX12770.1 redoxin family protein [Xanthomonadales bacterium]
MTIQAGDRIPDVILTVMSDEGPLRISSRSWFEGRLTVLFSVPGAFTPTCSARHLPGFIEHAGDFRARGFDAIGCMAVNDIYVMDAWARSSGANGIDMLADGNGEFATALGLEQDSRDWGMGLRSRRFAMVADDGLVTHLFEERPGEFRVSAAEYVLAKL